MPSCRNSDAERQTLGAVDRVDADGRDQQAEAQADQAVDQRAAAERARRSRARSSDREKLRRSRNVSATLATGFESATITTADNSPPTNAATSE